jgi:hypothetical protein
MIHEPAQKFVAYLFTAAVVGVLVLMWIVTAPLLRWGLLWRNRYGRGAMETIGTTKVASPKLKRVV